ncbi:MAG: DUF4430 domain-containing protein [Firmicutes bacterium]|nr:DUF4430 domain-containing protein [Bacillota bacterium]
MKKTGIISIIAVMMLGMAVLLSACSAKDGKNTENTAVKAENVKNIEVVVYDASGAVIYDNKIATDSDKLLDALKGITDLKIVSEDSQYGAFITSINDIKQDSNHFWNYYINGEYANVGVSAYEVQNNDKIEFRLEEFNG